jgi:membrane dipeptidase
MTPEARQLELLHLESPYPVIRTAWEAALERLKPDRKVLERGLELHAGELSLDHFGFLPAIHTPELEAAWNALREAQLGGSEFHFELSLLRQRAGTRTPEALREFLYALAASGLSGMIQTAAEGKSLEQDLKRLASFRGIERAAGGALSTFGSAEELAALHAKGTFALALSVNGPPLTANLMDPRDEFQWLETWHDLGVRLMHLTYNRRNPVGDGCMEETNAGLSDLGRELVARLNRLGIIIDVPHSGEQTCLDAIAASTRPVMATHTGRKSFCNHPRTKSDKVLKAIADSGGLVGVVALPSLLGGEGSLTTLLDAVEDMVALIGSEHVAISTDYAHKSPSPPEYSHGSLRGAEYNPSWWGIWKPGGAQGSKSTEHFGGSLHWTNWPLFTVGLATRGFSDDAIKNILGANFQRVLAANAPAPAGSLP